MALTKEQRLEIIKEFGLNEKDSGSTSVQIALLTHEINILNEHLKVHHHDFHSERGLLKKVGQRKSLINYLKKNDFAKYQEVIKKLNLRR